MNSMKKWMVSLSLVFTVLPAAAQSLGTIMLDDQTMSSLLSCLLNKNGGAAKKECLFGGNGQKKQETTGENDIGVCYRVALVAASSLEGDKELKKTPEYKFARTLTLASQRICRSASVLMEVDLFTKEDLAKYKFCDSDNNQQVQEIKRLINETEEPLKSESEELRDGFAKLSTLLLFLGNELDQAVCQTKKGK